MVASTDFAIVSGVVVGRRKARGCISGSHDRSLVHAAAMIDRPSYAELHCHSAYSFLDGASPPDELLAEAHRLGIPALALTDKNGIYGSLAFAHAAQPLGLQAITGAEVTLTDGVIWFCLPKQHRATRISAGCSPKRISAPSVSTRGCRSLPSKRDMTGYHPLRIAA